MPPLAPPDSLPSAPPGLAASGAHEALLVAVGGALGSLLRAGASAHVAPALGAGPLATGIVNLSGSLLLGVLLGWLEQHGPRPRLRALIAVGLLGSFTTFAGLVEESVGLATARPAAAVAGLVGSIALGAAAFVAGRSATARGLARRARPASGSGR